MRVKVGMDGCGDENDCRGRLSGYACMRRGGPDTGWVKLEVETYGGGGSRSVGDRPWSTLKGP